MARLNPQTQLHNLPPRLRKNNWKSISSYSQASRGLFVQKLEFRIFTDTSISPSLSLRQCSFGYAFRAGHNLRDKEFRYLRTVRVTAAVHRGFSHQRITNFFNLPALGRRQLPYVVLRLCGNLCFWETVQKAISLQPLLRHPFSRSYGAILPSSLERVISRP